MNDGEYFQKLARLSGDLRHAAEGELMAILEKDGATEEGATKACEEIASHLAMLRIWRESDRNSLDQIGLVRELLEKLDESLRSLTPESEGLLQHYFWPDNRSQLPVRHDNWKFFQQLSAALPMLVEKLPTRPPKKGGHDARLHWAVRSACLSWKSATGRLPSATKSEDSNRTAPLYRFFARHADQEAFSVDTWARVLKSIKRSESQRAENRAK